MLNAAQVLENFLNQPEGGGLIEGYDPLIRVDGFTGAAGLSVLLPAAPARGTGPELALRYGSSAGNGEFGLGFSLGIPSVGRMTNRGVPLYHTGDAFTLSGAGQLTPALDPATSRPVSREENDEAGAQWLIRTYLPCQESTLPLIEQWTDMAAGSSHWRVVAVDGETSLFGVTALGRVYDPADPSRIFEWLIEEMIDRHGNRIMYEYKAEDGAAIRDEVYEQNRVITARRYLSRIRYGNYDLGAPARHEADQPAQEFAYEVVLDYGEYDLDASQPHADPYTPVRPWTERADPFSSYLSGFEIRTYRLCHGVLLFHRFPSELGPMPCLVYATRLGYREEPGGSALTSVTATGYQRQGDGSYLAESMPPLELTYSRFAPPAAPPFRPLEVQGGQQLAGYLSPGGCQPVDLDGEGLPGFLLTSGDMAWYYPPEGRGRYGAPVPLPTVPDTAGLSGPGLSVTDLNGDGGLQLLVYAPTATGYFARTSQSWSEFTPVRGAPTTYAAPRGELADLDGDGRSELVFVNRETLVFYPSLGLRGFGPAQSAPRAPGFPAASNVSGTEVVTFAGLMGDGLEHRVRITDGEVAVWPNLGHGRFGPPVLLGGAPRLPAGLPADRVRLADIDGSGTADLILVFPDRLDIYRNRSGNSFAPPLRVPLPIQLTSHDQVSFGDVLGTGTTAIVVSQMTGTVRHWYCDLCETRPGDLASVVRPNMLTGADNNLGATSEAWYGSSTGFLLADKRAGRPWLTRMPTAVPVVTRTVGRDAPGATVTTMNYRYHDGYYDPYLRRFSGFGFVESTRVQETPAVAPPARTRTWYHTGAYTEAAALNARRRAEYYAGDLGAYQMPDSVLTEAVTGAGGQTVPQAYRALAGRVLRTEAWGDAPDDPARSSVPYTVTDQNYTVRLAQPAGPHGPGSFYLTGRETVTSDYGTDPGDPSVEHIVLLETTLTDRDGAQTYHELSATVLYPRRPASEDGAVTNRDRVPEQLVLLVSAETALFTRVVTPFRMIGLPVEVRSLDIGGLAVPASGYFSFAQLSVAIRAAVAAEIPYGVPFTPGQVQSRPAAWQRTYYWNAAQAGALPLGEITALALEHHQEQAAFSDAWLAEVFGPHAGADDLRAAGYLPDDQGNWWNPGEVTSYFGPGEPGSFALPRRQESYASWTGAAGPYALVTLEYDEPYRLLVTSVTGYADASTPITATGTADYQMAALWQVTDGNGVISQVRFDPLRRVLVTSLFKPAGGGRPRTGDMDLADYQVLNDATFGSVLADQARYLQGAAVFYYYDQMAWIERGTPAAAITLVRPDYVSDAIDPPAPAQVTISYTDGSGRLAQQRQEAEAAAAGGPGRWIVSGTTIYTAAGEPAREYLPFYAAAPEYGPAPDSPAPQVLHYDAVGRLVRIDTPKGFIKKNVFTPWQRRVHDEDDTVLDSPFYVAFMASYPPDPTPDQRAEKAALDKAAAFYDTPHVSVLDNVGNPVRSIQDSIGDITADAFTAIVSGSGITSRELWDELHVTGYLVTSRERAMRTTVTGLFEPYTPGFALRLGPRFEQFAPATAALLRGACLTSIASFDQQARMITAADPRLFYASVQTGADLVNVSYSYPMSRPDPALTVSADSGPVLQLTDVLDRVVSAWDGRNLHQARTFDGLNRPVILTVLTADGASSTLEEATYGEHQPDGAAANLIGRLYEMKDETGVAVTPSYTIAGQPAVQERQYPVDYAAEPDWARDVPLDPRRYRTTTRYDALGRVVAQVTPDGTEVRLRYHVSGRVASVTGEQAGVTTGYLADARYNAAGQRVLGRLGNGAEQASAYDEATAQLTGLITGVPGQTPVQRVAYTYDPARNLTLTRDETAALVLGGPQPDGTGDYGYDATYRLLSATGIQHPGIDTMTYATGFKQTLFAPLPPARLDSVTLESYTETYGYDDAGNLVRAEHVAASVSFGRSTPVEPGSNRMAGTPYDGAGNPLTVLVNGPMTLSWGARGTLTGAAQGHPAVGGTERTWMSYDTAGERSRKVVEVFDTAGQLIRSTDVRYLGSYVEERVTTPDQPAGGVVGTVRAGDGQHVIAVVPSLAVESSRAAGVRYQVDDKLGSVALELDGDAAVLSYETFFPWGGSSVLAATDVTEAEPKVLRYTGKEADDSTSLYYYGARYLAPWLGRWLSPDPSLEAEGLNLYGFVNDNPVTLFDPDGRNDGDPDKPPPKQPSTLTLFRRGLQNSVPYLVFNHTYYTFYLGPRALYQRWLATPEQRALARTDRLARVEERNLKLFAISRILGINLERYLPAWVLRFIRPQTNPVSNWTFYGQSESTLDSRVRAHITNPEAWGIWTGTFLASATTSGLMVGLTRRLVVRNMSLFWRSSSFLSMTALTYSLFLQGTAYQSDLVWRERQARIREQAVPQRVRAVARFLWVPESWVNRAANWLGTQYEWGERSIYGLPRSMEFTEYEARQMQRYRDRSGLAWTIVGGGLAFRVALWWLLRRRAGGPGNALMIRPSNELAIWRGAISGGLARIPERSTALMIYRPRPTAVMIINRAIVLTLMGQGSPAVLLWAARGGLTFIQQRIAALMLQRSRTTALMIWQPPRNALMVIEQGNRALMVQGQASRALVPYAQGSRALVPYLTQGARTALFRPNAPGAGLAFLGLLMTINFYRRMQQGGSNDKTAKK